MSIVSEELLHSARFFAGEAISNAARAGTDSAVWSLAVLHLLTALEHLVKAMLAREHIALIREKLESKYKTVSLETAFQRIQDDEILGIRLTKKDMAKIKAAITARNAIAHGGIEKNCHLLQARFFQILSLLRDIFRTYFSVRLSDLANDQIIQMLIRSEKAINELQARALDQLDKQEAVFYCPECSQDFMALRDGLFLCLFCHCEEPSVCCDKCGMEAPSWTLNDVDELFEWGFSEGRAELIDNFGVLEKRVCDDCLRSINEHVDEIKREREYEHMEGYYYFSLNS